MRVWGGQSRQRANTTGHCRQLFISDLMIYEFFMQFSFGLGQVQAKTEHRARCIKCNSSLCLRPSSRNGKTCWWRCRRGANLPEIKIWFAAVEFGGGYGSVSYIKLQKWNVGLESWLRVVSVNKWKNLLFPFCSCSSFYSGQIIRSR